MEASELACHVSAGVVAGAAVEATLYPIDTIKTRLQAARGGAFELEKLVQRDRRESRWCCPRLRSILRCIRASETYVASSR